MEREDWFQSIKEGVENDEMEATVYSTHLTVATQSKKVPVRLSRVQVRLSCHT